MTLKMQSNHNILLILHYNGLYGTPLTEAQSAHHVMAVLFLKADAVKKGKHRLLSFRFSAGS
jgi:hypothetical protein